MTFIGHDKRRRARWCATLCRRLRTSERFARFVGALTRHHLVLGFLVHERPLDRARGLPLPAPHRPVEVEVTVLSCADRLATRGRNAEAAIAAHLELARELMAGGARLARAGPAARAGARRRAGARARHRARPGAGPAARRARARPPTRARRHARAGAVALARRLRRVIVDCAVYKDGARREGDVALDAAYEACREDGRLRLDRPVRADRGGVRVGPQRVRPAPARGRGRDPRPPAAEARGLRRHALHRAEDGPLRRPDRGRRVRRDPALPRRGLRHHRPPRRGERARRRARAARGGPRAAAARPGRGAARDRRPGRGRLRAR